MVAGAVVCGSVESQDCSYVAPGATNKNQITVEKDTLVGMRGVVTQNVSHGVVVAGIPAKFMRKAQLNDK